MERAAEVKRSAICFEEHVSGDGSMCAVRVTERAKLDESEAADGIARRSPKPLPADGGGIAKKRPRKPEEPPKEEKIKRSKEEKIKRSKNKRAEEKIKQPNNVEVHGLSMEKVMAKQAKFDKKRADEKRKKSNQEKRMEEMMRMEKIASKTEELVSGDGMKKERRTKKPEDKDAMTSKEQVAGDGMKKKKIKRSKEKQPNQVEVVKSEQVMIELAGKSKKKMKMVTQEINKPELAHCLSDEVWSYVMSIDVFTFQDCVNNEIGMSSRDPSTEAINFEARRMCIGNQADLLRQYRTNGHVVLQYGVPLYERDVDVEV